MDISQQCVVFDSGITYDRVFAHRGDIFIGEGIFKSIKDKDREDHVICKENRPILIISDDQYNIHIVKALALSSKPGSDDPATISSSRNIKIPNIQHNSNMSSYIDTSQIFTVNTYQLKVKIASVSQEIVDTAVAMSLFQNMNRDSVPTIVRFIQEQYPYSNVFTQQRKIDQYSHEDNTRNPNEQIFSSVQRVPLNELERELESSKTEIDLRIIKINDVEEADKWYKEWQSLGTDLFRSKYHLSKQQYFTFRDRCINKMLGRVQGFKKYDWEG